MTTKAFELSEAGSPGASLRPDVSRRLGGPPSAGGLRRHGVSFRRLRALADLSASAAM
jgi:hypothetical protein